MSSAALDEWPPMHESLLLPIFTHANLSPTDVISIRIEPGSVTVRYRLVNEKGRSYLAGGDIASGTLRFGIDRGPR